MGIVVLEETGVERHHFQVLLHTLKAVFSPVFLTHVTASLEMIKYVKFRQFVLNVVLPDLRVMDAVT